MAAGLPALLSLFIFFSGCSEALSTSNPKKPDAALIVNDLVETLSTSVPLPISLLQSKKERFFSELDKQPINEAFYESCEAFVAEATQETAVYLRSVPQTETLNTAKPVVQLLEGNVAYLYLPAPSFASSQKCAYVRFVRNIIRRLGRRSLKGWIIDVRDCAGYDHKTLLEGCLEMFDEGTLGFIVYEESAVIKDFFKQSGKLIFHDEELSGGGRLPQKSFHRPARIAVLQGQGTQSAGEVLVLSLKSQKEVKTFGQISYGNLHFYEPVSLKRGGTLLIKKGHFQTYQGHYHAAGLEPDDFVADLNQEADEPLNKALSWILRD